jgi:diguanylate cyclase (GGDEF)-like protein
MIDHEADVSTRTDIIKAAGQRLESRSIPSEDQRRLLDLLDLLILGLPEGILRDEQLAARLIDAIADSGTLMLLIEHQTAELDALKRITRNLTSSLELQTVLEAVVKEAMQLVKDAHDAQIFLYQDGRLTFGAELDEFGQHNEPAKQPRPNGLTYTVARHKQITVVEDIRTHPLYANSDQSLQGSIIGIPLIIEDQVVGVMNLTRSITGEFSPGEIRLLTLLADQAAIAIFNARLHAAVNRQAHSDVLTNLPNRRALDERLNDEIARSARSGNPFSVVMLDLDGFKAINDTYGHDVGDHVLRQVAAALSGSLRSTDFLARYGGDEMTLVLPDTDLPWAEHVARKLQEALRGLDVRLPDGQSATLGFSGGIALFPAHAETAAGLLRAADEALYRTKRHARGSFLAARPPTGELRPPANFPPKK